MADTTTGVVRVGSPRTLKATFWQDLRRLQEAASVPFRSLHFGGGDNEEVVTRYQQVLESIQTFSFLLPDPLLPHPKGKNGPPGVQWGPFIPLDRRGFFGTFTQLNTMRFQRQAGLQVDGKAGMLTLPRIDELLVFLEQNVPSLGGQA